MGYKATPEEIALAQEQWNNIEWEAESFECVFRTDPDFVREVLPPCLEPAGEPIASASIGFWWSEQMDEFYSAAIAIRARFKQYEGSYFLTLIMDGDMPITLGREVWGEPKKTANTSDFYFPPGQFESPNRFVRGHSIRNGVKLIEMEAEFGPDLGPRDGESTAINLKAFPDSYLRGHQPDPVVLVAERKARYHRWSETQQGSLKLFSSPQDPCGDVPVESIDKFVYSHIKRPKYSQVPHAIDTSVDYLPWIIGTKFDVGPTHPLTPSIRRW